MGSNTLLRPGLPLGGWVGSTQSIGWLCFALILIRRQRLRVSQGIEVNCILSPGMLLASPCWTRWQVGTKHNESLRNITWHPQTKSKDYGTMTKLRTQTRIMNTPTTPVCNNWPRFLVVELSSGDLPLSNCCPLLSRRVSRWWPESSKALKGWGLDLSWWSVLGNGRWWVFSRPLDLLIDQYMSPSTKRWIRHVASSAAVSCLAWWRWKSGRNCRNRV